MKPINRLIINAWLITQVFYLFFYWQNHAVFGKSDITNYINMIPYEMGGFYNMRHITISFLSYYFPFEIFLIFIPALYWFGIVYPISLLWPENGPFCFVCCTASAGLYFIVGLLSQFLSISLLLWSVWAYHRGKRRLAYGLCAVSCVYLPTIYFLVVMFAPINLSIIITLAAMFLMPTKMWYAVDGWFPVWGFLFYLSPILLIRFFRQASKETIFKVFLLSLTRSSRGLIYMLPFMRRHMDTTEKALSVIWCLAANYVILLGYIIEKGHF